MKLRTERKQAKSANGEEKNTQLNRFTARYAGFGIKGFTVELVKGEREGRGGSAGIVAGFGALQQDPLSLHTLECHLSDMLVSA